MLLCPILLTILIQEFIAFKDDCPLCDVAKEQLKRYQDQVSFSFQSANYIYVNNNKYSCEKNSLIKKVICYI